MALALKSAESGVITVTQAEPARTAAAPVQALPTVRQRETAQYVADMVLELRNLAKAERLHSVMAPLEFAYYEAFAVANRVDVPPAEAQRLKDLARTIADYEPSEPAAG